MSSWEPGTTFSDAESCTFSSPRYINTSNSRWLEEGVVMVVSRRFCFLGEEESLHYVSEHRKNKISGVQIIKTYAAKICCYKFGIVTSKLQLDLK